MLSACFDSHLLEQYDDSVWSTRQECLFTNYEVSHIYRVKTVYIFFRIYCKKHFFFINVFWKRQLHQNSMN